MEHAQEKFASAIQIYARLANDFSSSYRRLFSILSKKWGIGIYEQEMVLNINFILSRCAWILLLLPSQGHLL